MTNIQNNSKQDINVMSVCHELMPGNFARELTDEEFEDYVLANNNDLPIAEVTFFLPEFSQ